METNNFHREAVKMVLEATGRRAFNNENNVERDLFNQDLQEIIEVGREKIDKADLDWILGDLRYITQKAIFFNTPKDEYR